MLGASSEDHHRQVGQRPQRHDDDGQVPAQLQVRPP